MQERDEFLVDIRARLEQAQALQKRYYDKGHRPVSYQVGDWALLPLRQRPVASLPQSRTGKLKPRIYGPYRVVELINEVAVRLALPPQARMHNMFHVGLLKKFLGTPPATPPPLPPVHHGAVVPEPAKAVKFRLARGVHQVLVQWQGESPASATWEDVDRFTAKYPSFPLEDELLLDARGDVMYGRTTRIRGVVMLVTSVVRLSARARRARKQVAPTRTSRQRCWLRQGAEIGKLKFVTIFIYLFLELRRSFHAVGPLAI
jgi:hypothetical protein